MSSSGSISLQTTCDRLHEEALDLQVYRENTSGRTASLPVTVASVLLALPHLLLHQPAGNAWFVIVGQEIYQVGLVTGAMLRYDIATSEATVDAAAMKRFSHVVVGNAATLDWLGAPYDEENTRQIMHTEALAHRSDLFEFWQANPSSDQTTGRAFDRRVFATPA